MRPYPWQQSTWQRLAAAMAAGKLHHGLLFSGPEGVGKHALARVLAAALLCQRRDDDGLACGNCSSCRLRSAQTHPDLKILAAAEDSKVIKIEQVRELLDDLGLKPHLGGWRAVVVEQAERLNPAAANSLLKTLEEPPPQVVIILVSSHEASLLPTVRSRCQRLLLPRPDETLARQWLARQLDDGEDAELLLALAAGAPLRALQLAGEGLMDQRQALLAGLMELNGNETEPVALGKQWLKEDVTKVLYWLNSWVVDMVRLLATPRPPLLDNPDLRTTLAGWARGASLPDLLDYQRRLEEAGRQLQGNANPQLVLEDVLSAWRALRLR